MSKTPNFQELLSDFSNQSFVGRNNEIELFNNLLNSEKPDFLILGISGQGGVGKTTLLELYKRVARERNEITGISNEDNLNIPDVLQRFENQFQNVGIQLKHFTELQAKYFGLLGQIESDAKAPSNLLNFILKGVTHFGLQSLRYVPVAGVLVDILEADKLEGSIVEHSGEFVQYIFRKFRSKEDRALLLDTISSLTAAFVTDIDNISRKHKVFLVFDSFEKTQTAIEKWLIQLIDGHYGNFSSNITFIIAGRRILSQKWSKYGKAIRQIELREFSEQETVQYLNLFGIVDENDISVLAKISNRLPILLALLVSSHQKADDISDSAVERFLSGATVLQRDAALSMSVTRFFDEDIFEEVVVLEKNIESFEWLVDTPFVRMTDQGWVYHDVVRSLLNHYLRVRSGTKWASIHKKLSKLYSSKQRELEKSDSFIDPKREIIYKIERLYHKVCSSITDKTLGEFLSEFFVDYHDASNSAPYYLQAVGDAAQETENPDLSEITSKIKLLVDKGEKQTQDVLDSVEFLVSKSNAITPYALGKAYEISSDICFAEGLIDDSVKYLSKAISYDPNDASRYHNRSHMVDDTDILLALSDINKAIELKPNESLYYRCRANLYLFQDKDEEAIKDISKAIELNPNLSVGYHARAHYYEKKEQYEKALEDFTKAIELDSDNEDNYGCRGKMLSMNMGEHQKALDDFNKSISINPKKSESYHQRGHVQYRLQNYSEAISDITKALEYQPNLYLGCLIDIYLETQDYENMIRLSTSYIENGIRDIKPYQSRGKVKFITGQYTDAISDYNEAIKISEEKDASLFLERGVVNIASSQLEFAETDFNSALELLDANEKIQTVYSISVSYAQNQNVTYTCKWLKLLFGLLPKSIPEIIKSKNFDKIRDSEEFTKLTKEYLSRSDNLPKIESSS